MLTSWTHRRSYVYYTVVLALLGTITRCRIADVAYEPAPSNPSPPPLTTPASLQRDTRTELDETRPEPAGQGAAVLQPLAAASSAGVPACMAAGHHRKDAFRRRGRQGAAGREPAVPHERARARAHPLSRAAREIHHDCAGVPTCAPASAREDQAVLRCRPLIDLSCAAQPQARVCIHVTHVARQKLCRMRPASLAQLRPVRL